MENIDAHDSSPNGNTGASSSEPNNLRLRVGTFGRVPTALFTPEPSIPQPSPTVLQSLKAILLASWLNVLLPCIPVSWALHFALPSSDKKDTLDFIFSFLSIIPLAKLLSLATDELSMRVGQMLAGLMHVTLGNAVGLIIAIIALVKCELGIVQSSLVGSMLSNLLFVLGIYLFSGGLKYSEQGFGVIIGATQLNSSLLTVSVIAVLLPSAFHFSAHTLTREEATHDILAVSHGASLVLLPIYAGYLWFQHYSHTHLYSDDGENVAKSTVYSSRAPRYFLSLRKNKDPENSLLNSDATPEPELERPQMNVLITICLLFAVTVFVAFAAEWLVDSISGLTSSNRINKEFVGVILIPIVNNAANAAEHVTAVKVSVKDNLILSLGVAVGSSIQIALFVVPFIITLAWMMNKPLTLLFDPYESVALFLSVLTVNYVVQDGKSNWLEGFVLMCLYLILAVTFWYYPGYAGLEC